jgi:hypothetical protein
VVYTVVGLAFVVYIEVVVAEVPVLVQVQVYIELDQVHELELDKVVELEQDMVEEQVQVRIE